MKVSIRCESTLWEPSSSRGFPIDLIAEEPLSIHIEGSSYAVIMRTPGDEIAHAAGFCLSEGIVDRPEEFGSLAFCDDLDANVVSITLTAARRRRIAGLLERRGYLSQTSCGICGKTVLAELKQLLVPLTTGPAPNLEKVVRRLVNLSGQQPLHKTTHATHAAMLCDAEVNLLALAEDVGRHNALDKAIGKLFMQRKLGRAVVLLLSSRISYELVQKAARASVAYVFSISRPTSLAFELARSLNIRLGCLAPGDGLYLF